MKYRSRGATSVAVLACLTLAGAACAELDQPEEDLPLGVATQGIGGGPGGGTDEIPTQGEYLFGASIDDVLPGALGPNGHEELFSVKLDAQQEDAAGVRTPVEISYLGRGAVSIDGSTVFAGTLIMTPTAGTGELRAVYFDGDADWANYALSWRASATSGWEPLCDGDVAIPVFHSFRRDGTHARPTNGPTDRLSWSCFNGVVAKCWWWGYYGGGVPSNFRESQWQLHAACTRMARADRCATGTPHTREGTEIRIFDRVGIRDMPPDTFQGLTQWPPPVNVWSFESAWVSGDEGGHAAKCTNHLRWAGLPSEGGCAVPLPDPRTDVDADACDDIFSAPGPLGNVENLDDLDDWMADNHVSLLQSSRWNDLPLIPWISGNDRVTTIDGYVDHDTIKRPYNTSYAPDPQPFVAPVLDGTLVRQRTASMVGLTEQVFLYVRGMNGDRVLLTQAMANLHLPMLPPNNFAPTTPAKGWIFTADNHPDIELVAVHLYRRLFPTMDYTTATEANRPAGYGGDLGIVGYTPAIEAPEE
jgi:hypothetical protein